MHSWCNVYGSRKWMRYLTSNPEWGCISFFTYRKYHWERFKSNYTPSSSKPFNIDMATSLGEGKLRILISFRPRKRWALPKCSDTHTYTLIYIYIYIYTRIRWKVHGLTKILSWNVTKWGLFFNIVPVGVHTLLPSALQSFYITSHAKRELAIWFLVILKSQFTWAD